MPCPKNLVECLRDKDVHSFNFARDRKTLNNDLCITK